MSRPEIRSIKDLKGRVLGVATLTSGEYLFLSRRLLTDAGIDADKEMTLRVIGNTPDWLQSLRVGAVDATTLTLPVDIPAERMGLRRLAFMGEMLESINGGYGVSERWLQQRPGRDQNNDRCGLQRHGPRARAAPGLDLVDRVEVETGSAPSPRKPST